MSDLRTIKTVVGGMTLLLVVMLGAVAWGLVRAARLPAKTEKQAEERGEAWTYALPSGIRILSATSAGESIAVLGETSGERVVFLLDPRPGGAHLVGTIRGQDRTPPPDGKGGFLLDSPRADRPE